MYAKLFARITESSLMEEPINVRYTFVMMLAISDPEGYVIGTDVAIARRLNMPLAELKRCLAVLMAPDPDSNSQELEGRRITVSTSERGYHVVNFVTYRDIKDQKDRREYMREYMRNYRHRNVATVEVPLGEQVTDSVNSVNIRKPHLTGLTQEQEQEQAEADENAEIDLIDHKDSCSCLREDARGNFCVTVESIYHLVSAVERKLGVAKLSDTTLRAIALTACGVGVSENDICDSAEGVAATHPRKRNPEAYFITVLKGRLAKSGVDFKAVLSRVTIDSRIADETDGDDGNESTSAATGATVANDRSRSGVPRR